MRSAGDCSFLHRKQLPTTSTSISLPIKQRNASSGVHTIGSPRTLKLVLTKTGQPVKALKRPHQLSYKLQKVNSNKPVLLCTVFCLFGFFCGVLVWVVVQSLWFLLLWL